MGIILHFVMVYLQSDMLRSKKKLTSLSKKTVLAVKILKKNGNLFITCLLNVSCASADNVPSRVCALVICRSQSVALRRSRDIICFLSSLSVIWSPSKVTVL